MTPASRRVARKDLLVLTRARFTPHKPDSPWPISTASSLRPLPRRIAFHHKIISARVTAGLSITLTPSATAVVTSISAP
jgi:hypothetical protein